MAADEIAVGLLDRASTGVQFESEQARLAYQVKRRPVGVGLVLYLYIVIWSDFKRSDPVRICE